ncbi:ketodeoxygluconokinase [Alteromonas sp. KC3]|uniref:sugar kinase n=1 Tax=unclassified Alteromonas TaxID=2614992 RepID=UPI00192378BF|nr:MULTISPECIES: sugar kinase [unclassified Alteromonas]BCO18842.1 ketodeoxygluconokinase [Alteromonas sp. KC3]BCO22805.1 ketodeoxygluconokinase [Alteromonas sp. KC14]
MPQNNHGKSLLAIGECMVELASFNHSEELCRLGFAGDTLNALIYAKRWDTSLKCAFYSAVGVDNFSSKVLSFFEQHEIDTEYVARSRNRNIGLYSIVIDKDGERSFDYWREQSAARVMMSLHQARNTVIQDVDMLFFSGIALSIMSEDDKQKLIELVSVCKSSGVKIAFDPNYRPSMWSGHKHAKLWFDKAYQLADIALPGLDDHKAVYDHENVNDVVDYLSSQNCKEFVVKAGKQGMFAYVDYECVYRQAFKPVKQTDTTAAGDSFAGVYLASRLKGEDVSTSVAAADAMARQVVQHHGAIVPQESTEKAKNEIKQQCGKGE